MPDPQKRTRGNLINGYAKYLKNKWGAEGMRQCSDYTGLDLNAIVNEKWYPADQADAMLKWVADTKGMDHVRRMGYEVVSERGIITYVARIAGLRKVLERGIQEYRENISFGDVKVVLKDRSARITMVGSSSNPAVCEAWVGALQGLLAITKTKGTVKKPSCQLNGEPACVYEIEW